MRKAQRVLVFIAVGLSLAASVAVSARPIQVYGVWHCGKDLCGWDTVRDMSDFDAKNNWLVDRDDGTPPVNLVALSFVDHKMSWWSLRIAKRRHRAWVLQEWLRGFDASR